MTRNEKSDAKSINDIRIEALEREIAEHRLAAMAKALTKIVPAEKITLKHLLVTQSEAEKAKRRVHAEITGNYRKLLAGQEGEQTRRARERAHHEIEEAFRVLLFHRLSGESGEKNAALLGLSRATYYRRIDAATGLLRTWLVDSHRRIEPLLDWLDAQRETVELSDDSKA